MTGTPYNNRSQDLATLMTFVDPTLSSAQDAWWTKATSNRAAEAVVEAVADWRDKLLIRRDKSALGDSLTKKTVSSIVVAPSPLELPVYEEYEQSFARTIDKLAKLVDDPSPRAVARRKKLFDMMLSSAACMRMALIHPVIPAGGRDWTIHFSPTRSGLAMRQNKPSRCVCCRRKLKKGKKEGNQDRRDAAENLNDELLLNFIVDDDDEESLEETEDESNDKVSPRYGNGAIVPIPRELCLMPEKSGLLHYACESCLEELKSNGGMCPSCKFIRVFSATLSGVFLTHPSCTPGTTLSQRAHLGCGEKYLAEQKRKCEHQGHQAKVDPSKMPLTIDRPVLCKHILGGFKNSAKIQNILSHLESIPSEDKVLIFSFFKGSLDLLEAIFHYELKVKCARFDGDFGAEERQGELQRFKSDPECCYLLSTVDSGGTGINIVEVRLLEKIFYLPVIQPLTH